MAPELTRPWVLLAAGLGRRFGEHAQGPKCLLDVGEVSLLELHLRTLEAAGVRRVIIVAGFQAERIRNAMSQTTTRLRWEVVVNELYASTGSGYSLWLALQVAPGLGGWMDTDLWYEPKLIKEFVQGDRRSALLVDPKSGLDEEAVKALSDDTRLVELDKRPTVQGDGFVVGESVGIVRIAPRDARTLRNNLDEWVSGGLQQFEWEEAVRGTLDHIGWEVLFNPGHLWMEIDTVEDLERAKSLNHERWMNQ